MKKFLVFVLSGILLALGCIGFTGCGGGKVVQPGDTIVVGVTDYEPFDSLEEGKWVGFDADLATKVFGDLGFTVKFQEIDWDTKIVALNAGDIDCIWNGMTVTDELLDNLLLSDVYLKNKQVVVIKKENASSITKIDDLKNKKVSCESGGVAEEILMDLVSDASKIVKSTNQHTAITEVSAGTCDVALVDYALAKSTVSADPNLVWKEIGFEIEEYSAAVRKSDSKLLWQINKELAALTASGYIKTLAEKWGVENQLPEYFN